MIHSFSFDKESYFLICSILNNIGGTMMILCNSMEEDDKCHYVCSYKGYFFDANGIWSEQDELLEYYDNFIEEITFKDCHPPTEIELTNYDETTKIMGKDVVIEFLGFISNLHD
jgi:hypothetical protein